MKYIIITLIIINQLFNLIFADEFVYTRFDLTNMRSGPSKQYFIKWIYIRKNIPFKFIKEFESWYLIQDIDNSTGWIYKNLLTHNQNYAFIKNQSKIYLRPSLTSQNIATIDPLVLVRFEKCSTNWCRIKVNANSDKKSKIINGWIEKNQLWGA